MAALTQYLGEVVWNWIVIHSTPGGWTRTLLLATSLLGMTGSFVCLFVVGGISGFFVEHF